MIGEKTLKALEYDKVLARIAVYAQSEVARAQIHAGKPAVSSAESERLLEETEQALRYLSEWGAPACAVPDYEEILAALEKEAPLGIAQLRDTAALLRAARTCRREIDAARALAPALAEIADNLFIDADLEKRLMEAFEGEEVSDNASAELRRIRREIRACNERIRDKLGEYVSDPRYATSLRDAIVTLRNNRYVLPVRAESKSKIEGLVHDRSASGATVFIEPLAVVRLNNELKELQAAERAEIERILRVFSAEAAAEIEGLRVSYRLLPLLDCIFARAAYARDVDGIRPRLRDDGAVAVRGGRHPLLDPRKVVPVDISVGGDTFATVITGPNTGGKTVALKLIGLLELMGMSGIFLPAREDSEIAFFERIFCDVGDSQSIEENLSTFSAHIVALKEITEAANASSLVLLDELGAGTDPSEGGALAVAILEFLRGRGSRVVCTSHYAEVKEYAVSHEEIQCASMEFDPRTHRPTYRLIGGVSGSSNALDIARGLGLPEEIVAAATARLGSEKIAFDALAAGAERARRQAEDDRDKAREELREARNRREEAEAMLAAARAEREKLDAKIAKGVKKLVEEYAEEAEELLDTLKKEIAARDEQALFRARKIAKKLKDAPVAAAEKREIRFADGAIGVGDSVYIPSLDATGEVRQIDARKRECTVTAGVLTMNVGLAELRRIAPLGAKQEQDKGRVVAPLVGEACPLELLLLGRRTDEAITETERYLERATAAGYTEVRIVHGKGTGALRKALHAYFRTSPYVASFRLGNYGEGDGGVTVVALK